MGEATRKLLSTPPDKAVSAEDMQAACAELCRKTNCDVYPSSLLRASDGLYFMTRGTRKRCGMARIELGELKIELRRLDHATAVDMRRRLSFLAPSVVGLKTSLGLGDRLGLATPGHIRAVRGTGVAPVLAQQSIRELTRTRRTADEVMDAATWGAFQEGYRDGFGSDADHLKTKDDIDLTAAAGFTMFTVDPGDHVNDAADAMDAAALEKALRSVPWDALETTHRDFEGRYSGRTFDLGELKIECSSEAAARAAVKYAAAVAHTADMYRHLASVMNGRPFELEMSVDETNSPTSAAEHYYVASELARLGVQVVSLAPRFVGDFEKGVDYKGDLVLLEKTFREHTAIARALGPYKISIHSGSDKFSVYDVAAKVAGGLVHVKTAGTSYLEALRAIARVEPGFFREILAFALDRWDEDRATYHVSADPAKVRRPAELADDELTGMLDEFDARQVLHVTFGSVLTAGKPDGTYLFRDRFYNTLTSHEEEHYAVLEKHLRRHAAPFSSC